MKRVYSIQLQSPPMTPSTFLGAIRRIRDDGFTVTEYDSHIPHVSQQAMTAPTTTSVAQTSVPPFYSENDSSDNSDDYFEVIEQLAIQCLALF